jgi:mycoredoxin
VTESPAAADLLTVFWRPGCPFCFHLRTRLRWAGIPYRAVDIWADRDAAAVVRGVNGGDELVPTVRIGADTFLSNPSMRELRAALADAGG